MKLTALLLVTCLAATSYVALADEVDAEIIDDDDVSVEDEDDLDVNDDGEADLDDMEVVEEGAEEEQQPQMMPGPMSGVRVFTFFPEGAHSITGGKLSEVLVGIQNNGDVDLQMATINGRMLTPGTQEIVQNFTNIGYNDQVVGSKSEASFAYAFLPHIYTGGREFDVVLEVYYKEHNTQMYYRAVPFNEAVNVLESTEGVATEIAFLWSTIIIIALVGFYFFYQRVLCKYLGIKSNFTAKKVVETGTVNENVRMDWIPEGHSNVRKRTAAK